MTLQTQTFTHSGKWLPHFKLNDQAMVRLFCFPYSGAGVSIFNRWSEVLPDLVDTCPVQLPGRENRIDETPFTNLFSLVEAVAQAIRPFLDQPFAFFGHSMGALLSFELARFFRREGLPSPSHLFVSSHLAPRKTHYKKPLHTLPEPEFFTRLQKLNGTPAEVLEDSELKHLFQPLLRADFKMCETYIYTEDIPLNCPITALGGLADPFLNREDLGKWRHETTSSFMLRMFPGDHFYLHKQRPLLLHMVAQDLFNGHTIVA